MRRAPHVSFCILFILFVLPVGIRAQSNSLADTVRQLRQIETCQDGRPSTDVPPLAQKLLPELKSQFRALVLRIVNEHAAATPESLRTFLLASFKDAGVGALSEEQFENNYNPDAEKYGYISDVQVYQPVRHSDLLVVDVSLAIPCGDDHSLTVVQRMGSAWQPAIAADANGYSEVSGAQGWLKYAISPPDADGNWFLVTANATPWCSSFWQGLHYKVLRPGSSPETPQVLLEEHRGVYLGVDEPFRLTITSRGFEIHYVEGQGLDASLLTRIHVQKYKVEANKVSRIPPFALFPEDFLDEWFDLKWEEASPWISTRDDSDLQRWHERFASRSEDHDFFTEFDFVQPCFAAGSDARWQIGLSLEGSSEKDLPEDVPEELFFTVVKRDGAFYIDGVAEERPGGCPGESRPRGYSLNSPLP
jgi:hypothetical protein